METHMTLMKTDRLRDKIRSGFAQGLVLAVLSTAVALGANMVRPGGLDLPGNWNVSAVVAIHNPGFSLVTPDEAFRLYSEDKIIFVDARDEFAYEQGHLPGALNVPVDDAGKYLEQLRSVVNREKGIVTYCDGAECPLSFELAEILKTHGIGPVEVMEQGWTMWYESGLPIEEGAAE